MLLKFLHIWSNLTAKSAPSPKSILVLKEFVAYEIPEFGRYGNVNQTKEEVFSPNSIVVLSLQLCLLFYALLVFKLKRVKVVLEQGLRIIKIRI